MFATLRSVTRMKRALKKAEEGFRLPLKLKKKRKIT